MTRHERIVQMLTNKVRLMTAEELARQWFGHTGAPKKIALLRLRREEHRGMKAESPAELRSATNMGRQ